MGVAKIQKCRQFITQVQLMPPVLKLILRTVDIKYLPISILGWGLSWLGGFLLTILFWGNDILGEIDILNPITKGI